MTTTARLLGALTLAAGLLALAPTQAAASPLSDAWSFILEGQRTLTQAMTTAVKRLQGSDPVSAAGALALVSFIYGVLHAAGPGHGKFVISSYALATERTARRGMLITFMAAFLQAVSAILIVGLLALVLQASSIQIKSAERWLEAASWGLIAVFGAWLLWRQLQTWPVAAPAAHVHHDHDHGRTHGHAHDGHEHAADGSCCGHAHVPEPRELEGQWSWLKAWSIAFSVGIRPCTGAIAVLLFALGIGLFWAGVLATFAMALGTALTVSALAAMAVGSRELAVRLAGDGTGSHRLRAAIGVTGAALVLAMGATLFVASLMQPTAL